MQTQTAVRLVAHVEPQIYHDFDAQPLCEIPIRLSLRNCLQSPASLCIETDIQPRPRHQESGTLSSYSVIMTTAHTYIALVYKFGWARTCLGQCYCTRQESCKLHFTSTPMTTHTTLQWYLHAYWGSSFALVRVNAGGISNLLDLKTQSCANRIVNMYPLCVFFALLWPVCAAVTGMPCRIHGSVDIFFVYMLGYTYHALMLTATMRVVASKCYGISSLHCE